MTENSVKGIEIKPEKNMEEKINKNNHYNNNINKNY